MKIMRIFLVLFLLFLSFLFNTLTTEMVKAVDVYYEFEGILLTPRTELAKMREPLLFWAHDDTVEPGESYLEAIQREVREETGASIVHYTVMGAYRCLSLADKPLRSHLPWPWFYQVIGFGEVELVARPTPTDREHILEVVALPFDRACQQLLTNTYAGAENVEILRLAADLRKAMAT